MTDRPIIFSAPMVRALLAGTKTQTRRLLKPQWADGANQSFTGWRAERAASTLWNLMGGIGIGATLRVGRAPGDRLWVKEAWNAFTFSQDGEDAWPTAKIPTADEILETKEAAYRFDVQAIHRESDRARKWFADQKWRPSIHMPRWASRLTLTVTEVRVQRLQNISEADAVAEGIIATHEGWATDAHGRHWGPTARDAYRILWNDLHGPGSWDANPWVVAVTFTVQRGNIDEVPG
jgi:hypothetical protein